MPKVSKPIKPDNDDCCGGGCCPCVWDAYYNQLDLWEEQEAKGKASADTPPADKGLAK